MRMKKIRFEAFAWEDEEVRLKAYFFYILLLTFSVASLLAILISLSVWNWSVIITLLIAFVPLSISFLMVRRGHMKLVGLIVSLTFIFTILGLQYMGQGTHDLAIVVYPITIIVASIALRRVALMLVTMMAIGAHGIMVYLELNGYRVYSASAETKFSDFLIMGVVLSVTAVAMHLITHQLWAYLAQSRANEMALLESNRQFAHQRNILQSSQEEAQRFQDKLQVLHEVNMALAYAPTLEALYEQAIRYGRERLGFDRLGLLLYDETTQMMIGAFGTDAQGNLRDERYFSMKLDKPEVLQILANKKRIGFWENTDLYDNSQVVGKGWQAMAVLWNGERGIGWLATDNLVKQEPASPMLLEILTLYGASLGYLITVKQSEVALKQYALELERSNQELQEFAYIASHDLQEPLRKIQTFGDLLLQKYGHHLDERGLLYLERMREASARMQMLIQDLLTYSRVQSYGEPFVSVDLMQVLTGVLSDLEMQILAVGASFQIGDMPVICADKTQMRQLFQNLISNALKFHRPEEPPVITITAERFTDMADNRLMHRISVADNGIGFEAQYAERIFGMFQRLHGRSHYEGSGIGLAICKRIVERHQGHITAQGVPNEGAVFTIILPFDRE